MRPVVTTLVVLLVLALGALEIFAARGMSDADVPGGASVHVWTAR
jgi:hypothetical protein